MDGKYILLLAIFMSFNNFFVTSERNIYVSNSTRSHNSIDCFKNSSVYCRTLDYVLEIISNASKSGHKYRTSIKIHVLGDQLLEENHNLTGLYNFVLSGDGNSVIRCLSRRGLIILSSEDIGVEHLTFLNCGSKQASQNKNTIFFLAGLFFSNIINVNVTGCMITNSTGIGMALLNVGGHVTFIHTHFTGNKNNSMNGNKIREGLAYVGGGLIIEFNDSTNAQHSSNNEYFLYNCTFINNGCTWNAKNEIDPTEADKKDVIFGCGGGMAMTFKGKSKNNSVHMENCTFSENLADWGGGYYFLFENKANGNFVLLKNVTAKSNHGVLSGGGGRFFFDPCFNFSEMTYLPPNYFVQENCSYFDNQAGWGGGVSVFGSSLSNTNLSFTNSHWVNNQALVGAALGFLSGLNTQQEWLNNEYSCSGMPYKVELLNCQFKCNRITNKGSFQNFFVGTGTIYVEEASIKMENVFLSSNNGTPLVLDLSDVYISGNVTFCNNSGNEGGAMALYGRSKIILKKYSNLTFTSNTAFLRGGAIYAYSQGPNLKAYHANLLERSTCFFTYEFNEPPNNWSASVIFEDNKAPKKSGKSIYCDTLQFCRTYGSISKALEWKPFIYVNSSAGEPEIVTDPVKIHTFNYNWVGFPGQKLSPDVTLKDEKDQPTNGLLKMSLSNSETGVHLGEQVSEYIYISDGKSSVPINFVSSKLKEEFDLTLSSVYTQVIKTTVNNITTTSCYGGYEFIKGKCDCLSQEKMPYGYRCGEDGETIYLKVGYWATIGKHYQLNVLPCPADYCKCANTTAKKSDECIFTKFRKNTSQCADNRHGRLCGSCDEGYSLVVGLNECRKCPSYKGLLWLLLLIVVLTFVVLLIIYFQIDFFSGPLNSWLYTYHIVYFLPYKDNYLDPFITLVISITYGQFDLSTGKCFWKGMDALQKRVLLIVVPFYGVFLLYFISKLLRYFPNLPLADRSFHHALVTIVIVFYAVLVDTTVSVLTPVSVDGVWYVFQEADIEFFGRSHLPYAIPALFILVFIVIPFPFVIAFSAFFTRRFQCLRNFIPMFEALQNPYRPSRTWFASYYIFCRLIFISMLIFRFYFEFTLFPLLEAVCVIFLLVFVLLRPYNDDNFVYFYVDTCFLSLLCLIICGMNAVEDNKDRETVRFLRVLVIILIYIPFVYSLVLFTRYGYRRFEVYMQRRRERQQPLLL